MIEKTQQEVIKLLPEVIQQETLQANLPSSTWVWEHIKSTIVLVLFDRGVTLVHTLAC